MISNSPIQLFTIVTNGVATPKPYYVAQETTNRVNGRISLTDIQLSNGVKGEFSFWVKNLFNHVDPLYTFGAGNSLNATTPRPQSAIYIAPPRTFGGEFRALF